jgi:DNA-binding NarL/FixJ family response regulator
MPELRVMLVDDHPILREALQVLVDGQPDMIVVAEAGGAQEALQLAARCSIDVIVMDLSLPDGDGIIVTEQMLGQYPHVRVVGLTWYKDRRYLTRMLEAGARGYVLKNNVTGGLLIAIRAVAAGETYIDPHFSAMDQTQQTEQGGTTAREAVRAPASSASELTTDELVVLQQVAWGHTNREIGDRLGMFIGAVAEHKAHAMQKLGLGTRIDVLRYAEAHGWTREDTNTA